LSQAIRTRPESHHSIATLPLPLNYGYVRVRRHDSSDHKTRRFEELAIFKFRAFSTSVDDKHGQIHKLTEHRLVSGWNDALGDEDLSALTHGLVDIAKNFDCSIIIPVVEDVPQQVGVGAGRQALGPSKPSSQSLTRLKDNSLGRVTPPDGVASFLTLFVDHTQTRSPSLRSFPSHLKPDFAPTRFFRERGITGRDPRDATVADACYWCVLAATLGWRCAESLQISE
jgi:hypothetical protein